MRLELALAFLAKGDYQPSASFAWPEPASCPRPLSPNIDSYLNAIRANSAGEALPRLEDLIGVVTQRPPYRAITHAINLVVFIERTAQGRLVRSVSRVVRRQGDD